MAYNPNIPQASDKRAVSQSQIRANYQAINEAFAENHAGLTQDVTIRGKHNMLVLQDQGMTDPTTSANEIAVYNKLVSSIPNVFLRPSSNQTPIQMTYSSIGITTSPNYGLQQYTFMAGPFLIHGGRIATPANNQTVILTPLTTILHVSLNMVNYKKTSTGLGPLETVIPTAISGNSFKILFVTQPAGVTFDVYYLVVGL